MKYVGRWNCLNILILKPKLSFLIIPTQLLSVKKLGFCYTSLFLFLSHCSPSFLFPQTDSTFHSTSCSWVLLHRSYLPFHEFFLTASLFLVCKNSSLLFLYSYSQVPILVRNFYLCHCSFSRSHCFLLNQLLGFTPCCRERIASCLIYVDWVGKSWFVFCTLLNS